MTDDDKAADRGGQPAPVPTGGPGMHDLLIEQLADARYLDCMTAYRDALVSQLRDRRELGLRRYGTLLQAHNGRDTLRDAVEEAVDCLAYVRALVEECDRSREPPLWLQDVYHDTSRLAMLLAGELARRDAAPPSTDAPAGEVTKETR